MIVPTLLLKSEPQTLKLAFHIKLNFSFSNDEEEAIRLRLKKNGLDPKLNLDYRRISNVSSTFCSTLALLATCSNFPSGDRRFHSTETAVLKVSNSFVFKNLQLP